MDINWYPGHMAKAKRLLADQLSRVDVVVELCDARLPYSSRNPDLDKLLAGKKRVLLLNKADLADPAATSAWLNYFRAQGIDAAPYSASTGKAKDALAVIDRAAKEAVERAAQKGIRKTVKAMVVGVPNVGKSTFTNKLHGGNIAKTGDRPGVTRANQWVRITPYLDLLDTPGLLWPRLDDQLAARRLCYIGHSERRRGGFGNADDSPAAGHAEGAAAGGDDAFPLRQPGIARRRAAGSGLQGARLPDERRRMRLRPLLCGGA
ncbi:MAG: ribosome biogenesis GTPase YlqF [Christensenellales bacterium]